MEQKHRTILRHYWCNIRDNLEPNNILPKLVLVLRETDEEEIREQSTRQERCDKLLYILPTRGENAFNVFVNALVKEAPHLASELTEADTKTEEELKHAREQSANLRGEIRKLKAKWEEEKQNHEKTLQELKKLTSLLGKENETKEVDITPDVLQKKQSTTESQKEQDQKRQKENFEEDERLLQKYDYVDEKNKREKQSENFEAAKDEQEKITQLQRENKQLKEKVTTKMLEIEKKLKDSFKKFQTKTKDKDVLPKPENLGLKNKRLHEQSNGERSKCDALGEVGRRLKEIPGPDESCSRCATLRNERDSAMTEIETWREEIQELNKGITKIIKDYQLNTQTPNTSKSNTQTHRSPQQKAGKLPHKRKVVKKKQQQERMQDLQKKNNKLLEDPEKSKEVASKQENDLLKSQKDSKKLEKDLAYENERVKEYDTKFKESEPKLENDLLKEMLKNETHMREEINSLREKLKEERSKSDNLRKDVQRLRSKPKEMQGSRWFLQSLPHCRPGFKKSGFYFGFLVHVQK